METNESSLEFKKVVRWFDCFGESFTFRYKDEDKLSTVLGGIIFIIFSIIWILYFIYNLIPFIQKENFTLQYYTMNLNNTEPIELAEAPTALAIGLTDNNYNSNIKYNISDLFTLSISFITKSKEGKKEKYIINKHPCSNMDFHNLHQKSFEELNIHDLNCLPRDDLKNNSLKGIYTDESFSYYEISVESKYKDNATHNQLINNYLIEYDCKLQFYYTDITINLTNFKEPFSSFLNSLFLQLNPNLLQKKNIFFMNYHLYDDDSLLHVFNNNEESKNRSGLSRIEDYAIYKGLNRTNNKLEDYDIYAKMYIRVDNRKIEIKRRYQDLMEFYADFSSLLLSIFWILGKFFAYYDRVKANHSISKKLFYFEGIKGNKFETFKRLKKCINFNSSNIQSKKVIIDEKKIINSNNLIEENPGVNSKYNPRSKSLDKNELIDFTSYNIFEILTSFKLFFCKTQKFKSKINLIEQANNLIDDKLDIVFYVRNMILSEYINKITLENMNIINFLSRPIIYLNDKKQVKKYDTDLDISIQTNDNGNNYFHGDMSRIGFGKNSKSDLYKSAYRLDFGILSEKIRDLTMNHNKTNIQKKLIYYLKNQFRGIHND